jgi:hypothetical protein
VLTSSIYVEQKRREAIRAGFDRLCELVPGLEGQGRSEGLVLKRTVDYMREQLIRRRELVMELEARGEHVSERLKEYVYPGITWRVRELQLIPADFQKATCNLRTT